MKFCHSFGDNYYLYFYISAAVSMGIHNICHGKYYISIYRSRKVAVCLLRAQQSEREMHVAMHGTDCVSEVTNLLKELH